MKYHIITYGCQMNENDSERMAGVLEQNGYEHTDDLSECDIIIMNTCSVRENADDHFFGNLGDIKKYKKANPNLIIAVCGCMVQQEYIQDKIKKKYPLVDIMFGTYNNHLICELIEEYRNSGKRIAKIIKDSDGSLQSEFVKRKFDYKAYVSITFGCDNFCSYCIVPYTRGREISRKKDEILDEIRCLAKNGCKEVMLLGQNVNSYNKNNSGGCSFADLLRAVDDIDGIERVRFMSSHPKDFNDDVLDAIKNSKHICHNIHLPLQAGSTKVLKEMNRRYTKEDYLKLFDHIKEEIPDITVSTDIIVGFPTETEEDFLDTIDVVEHCRFDSAFTFIYSPRTGTRAAKMEFVSTKDEIKDRFQRLLSVQHKIMQEKSDDYTGKVLPILCEGTSKNNPDMFTGRTMDNKLCNFTAADVKEGDIVNVKITEGNTFYITGELVK